jgi:alkanesulfonate monooxygenase SsuD/methylene tetrahydromethanopterin reductase-like flavin-dependent oxidoreductase (luciferase family)
MVAKMAETFDRLSGGRLILGLGGGYSDEEFKAFGLGTYSPRDKVNGLEEAIRICRGLWSQTEFTFDGRIHRTEKADLEPKPGHRIPIWVGTYGPRALDVTARLADGWIPSLSFAPPDQVKRMRERIMSKARAAGRNPEELTCTYNLEVNVGKDNNESLDVVSGKPREVSERLIELAKLGFTAMNFMPVGSNVPEQVEILARDVIPTVREAI